MNLVQNLISACTNIIFFEKGYAIMPGEIIVHEPNRDFESRLKQKANKLILRFAGGNNRAYSVLKHYGRISGREYLIPLSAYPLGDGFVMALLYGNAAQVDWCRNIIATGKCILKTQGREFELGDPEIISIAQAEDAFPKMFKVFYRIQGIKQFLWVHQVTV
jgi:hypothetical protein